MKYIHEYHNYLKIMESVVPNWFKVFSKYRSKTTPTTTGVKSSTVEASKRQEIWDKIEKLLGEADKEVTNTKDIQLFLFSKLTDEQKKQIDSEFGIMKGGPLTKPGAENVFADGFFGARSVFALDVITQGFQKAKQIKDQSLNLLTKVKDFFKNLEIPNVNIEMLLAKEAPSGEDGIRIGEPFYEGEENKTDIQYNILIYLDGDQVVMRYGFNPESEIFKTNIQNISNLLRAARIPATTSVEQITANITQQVGNPTEIEDLINKSIKTVPMKVTLPKAG